MKVEQTFIDFALAETPTDRVVHHGLVLLAGEKAVKRLTSGLPLLKSTDTAQ